MRILAISESRRYPPFRDLVLQGCYNESRLAAHGMDLVSIKDAVGLSALATTGRYLHARPASEQAAAFTRAFLARDDTATHQPVGGDARPEHAE